MTTLDRTLSVAPMMDWTDRHCRYFHRLLAPHALLYTEMVHAQAVLRGDRARLLDFDASEHPLALQLGGSDPLLLAQAARIGEDWGYDEINLNVGCPSDRVQAGRFGACLMREPALVADCVASMRAAVSVPATVKCRLGVDELDSYEVFRGFVDCVAAAGCTVFVVHARKAWLSGLSPKENREVPPLRYEWAERLKAERLELQIVLNGGLLALQPCLDFADRLDGVMLGRAAYHDPWLLRQLDRALFEPAQPHGERRDVLLAMRPYIEARLDEGTALKHIVRHLLGLFANQAGGRRFRQVLSEGSHRAGAGFALIERALAAVDDAARPQAA